MRSRDKKECNPFDTDFKDKKSTRLVDAYIKFIYTIVYIITVVLNKVLIKVGSFVMAIIFRYLDIHNSKHL